MVLSQTRPEVPRRSGVIERLTLVFDVVAYADGPVSLEEVVAQTGLPRSTAFRLLAQMVELRWLAAHPTGGYELSRRVRHTAMVRAGRVDIRAAAAEPLFDLHRQTGGVARLTVLEDAEVLYLDKIGGAAYSSVPSSVGARVPARFTVSGQSLLACQPPEWVATHYSSSTCTAEELSRLAAYLGEARTREGVRTMTPERHPLGMVNVSSPVLGPDGAVAAVSVVVPRGSAESLVPLVVLAARHTSEQLFPKWYARQRKRRRTSAGSI